MPRNGANRLAQIAEALQWDRGRWIWLLLILLVLDLVLGLGDSVGQALRYDRSAIAAGGWWRLLTAHIVHLDLHHLLLNELGLVLMWSLFARDYDPVEWCVIVLSGALAISCGSVVAEPARHLVRGRLGRAALDHGRGLRQASGGARLGSLDSARRLVRQTGLRAARRARAGAHDRRRRPSVRRGLRICGRGCTLLAYRYNSPPFSVPRDLHAMSLAFVFPGQGSQSVGMMSALATDLAGHRGDLRGSLGGPGLRLVAALPGGPGRSLERDRMHSAGDVDRRRSDLPAVDRARRRSSPASWPDTASASSARWWRPAVSNSGPRSIWSSFAPKPCRLRCPRVRAPWQPFWGSRMPTSKPPVARRAHGEVVEAVNFNAPGQVVIAGAAPRRSRVPSRPPPPRARDAR